MNLFFPLWTRGGGIGAPQKDESMARVQRLLMASIFELPAEQWLKDMSETGYHDFPAYKKFLQDAPNPNYTFQILLPFICKIDGSNMQSEGDNDIMRLTREFLNVRLDKPDWQSAAYSLLYLSQKGDAQDLSLLEEYLKLPSKLSFAKSSARESHRILNARVSGTNVLSFLQSRNYCWSTNNPPFLPSVANTGPQAVFVYDLLEQALIKYGTPTNIPSEIMTLVISLDAEGKPVCSIDPSKYGLKMPAFELNKEALPKQQKNYKDIKDIIDQPTLSNVNTEDKRKKCLSLPVVFIGFVVLGLVGLTVLFLLRKMRG